jgi:hypothetical protein
VWEVYKETARTASVLEVYKETRRHGSKCEGEGSFAAEVFYRKAAMAQDKSFGVQSLQRDL